MMSCNGNIIGYAFIAFTLFNQMYCWTEADEARRIQQLNEEEKAAFVKEQQSQNVDAENDYPYYDNYAPYRFPRPSYTKHSPATPRGSSVSKTTKSEVNIELVSENVGSNWCYHCASPLSILDRELAKVIEQLLSIRRSSYPANAVTSECSNPTNQTKMARQYCQHSYCSTIVLTDHETMNAFTMRGCAENFGAIDKAFLSKRGDNTCERLTEKVDVKECICKNRKYCYAGPQRKFSFETYEITDPSSDSSNFRKHNVWLLLFITLIPVIVEGDIRRMIY